jgi:hypothetical protein
LCQGTEGPEEAISDVARLTVADLREAERLGFNCTDADAANWTVEGDVEECDLVQMTSNSTILNNLDPDTAEIEMIYNDTQQPSLMMKSAFVPAAGICGGVGGVLVMGTTIATGGVAGVIGGLGILGLGALNAHTDSFIDDTGLRNEKSHVKEIQHLNNSSDAAKQAIIFHKRNKSSLLNMAGYLGGKTDFNGRLDNIRCRHMGVSPKRTTVFGNVSYKGYSGNQAQDMILQELTIEIQQIDSNEAWQAFKEKLTSQPDYVNKIALLKTRLISPFGLFSKQITEPALELDSLLAEKEIMFSRDKEDNNLQPS